MTDLTAYTKNSALLIASPSPFILLHDNWTDIQGYCLLSEYRAKHGKNAAQMLPFKRFAALEFTASPSGMAVEITPDGFGGNTVSITGKGLMQLLLHHGQFHSRTGSFSSSDLKLFLDGRALNEAENWLHEVALPLIDPTFATKADHVGSIERYIFGCEIRENAEFWRSITIQKDGPALTSRQERLV